MNQVFRGRLVELLRDETQQAAFVVSGNFGVFDRGDIALNERTQRGTLSAVLQTTLVALTQRLFGGFCVRHGNFDFADSESTGRKLNGTPVPAPREATKSTDCFRGIPATGKRIHGNRIVRWRVWLAESGESRSRNCRQATMIANRLISAVSG